jgi:hypothetical protein
MVNTENGLHGQIILTIRDSRGNVVLHETVRPGDAQTIIDRILPTIR